MRVLQYLPSSPGYHLTRRLSTSHLHFQDKKGISSCGFQSTHKQVEALWWNSPDLNPRRLWWKMFDWSEVYLKRDQSCPSTWAASSQEFPLTSRWVVLPWPCTRNSHLTTTALSFLSLPWSENFICSLKSYSLLYKPPWYLLWHTGLSIV